ncbi:uncharacterized protein DFL_005729 [Arthrobotrys flagrans]|uniref:Uncharacterized protein n=1 Tax=Arthrobotrys flagrans TaxID=97331 RepID=A0A436ZY85_ARTFL|nr:hypothetical protein DFL_005729 [Arthrobotrys flagrans]
MEPIKSIITKSPIEGDGSGPDPEAPPKKKKSVSFAESPEKPSKRRATVEHTPTPRLKIPIKNPNKFTHSARYSVNTLQWPRPKSTPKPSLLRKILHDAMIKRQFQPSLQASLILQAKPEEILKSPSQQSPEAKPGEIFESPSQPIEPFDPEKDWFTSMHASVSCTADPIHIVGVKQNKSKRQCEGIEGLDQRLLSGQVKIIFHPSREHEPVCETCWTMKMKSGSRFDEANEPELPGGWPSELPKGPPHTHIYDVVYEGCKHGASPANPDRHSLKLVKGKGQYGGNGTMCRCSRAAAKSPGSKGEESTEVITTQVPVPVFAGCPGCEGRNLRVCVRTSQTPSEK